MCIRLKDNSAPNKFKTSHFYQEKLFPFNFDRFSFAFQTLQLVFFKVYVNKEEGVLVNLSILNPSLFLLLSCSLLPFSKIASTSLDVFCHENCLHLLLRFLAVVGEGSLLLCFFMWLIHNQGGFCFVFCFVFIVTSYYVDEDWGKQHLLF